VTTLNPDAQPSAPGAVRSTPVGVATALVRAITSRLNGGVTLNVATENIAARSLYERLGFTVDREYAGQFRGHPCQICRLRYGAVA
jgi:RimJ/RimL family protein N-acetyltransferase